MSTQVAPTNAITGRSELSRSAGYFFIAEFLAVAVWLYAVTNTFVFSVDAAIMKGVPEPYHVLWNFKFLLFLAILAISFLTMNKANAAKFLIYIVLYPFVLLVWRIPKLLVRFGSWAMALSIANAIISYFHDLRYKIIVLFIYLTCFTIVTLSEVVSLLMICSIILMIVMVLSYFRAITSTFAPSVLLQVYLSVFSKTKGLFAKLIELDDELKVVPVNDMTPVQLGKWSSQLANAVLLNRACLFAARKLHLFQNSGFPLISGAFSVLFLVVMTTTSFAALNFSIYKLDPAAYECASQPSLFNFVFYSFNALVHNFIKEITPASHLSHALWMLESVFALAIMGLFAAHLITLRTQRYADQLAATAQAIENEGALIESLVSEQWKLSSIDDAMEQLEKVKSNTLALLVWLTKNSQHP